jgi:hypothetical protein
MPILAPRERPPFEEECEAASNDGAVVGVTVVSGILFVTVEAVTTGEPDEVAVTGDVPTTGVFRVICRVF